MVVLHNNVPLYEHGAPGDVLDAMFGERTFTVSWPTDHSALPAITRIHAGGSRSVTASHNTSVSAVGVLAREEAQVRLQVYHNPFARVPLPPALLVDLKARQFRVRFERDG